MRRPRPRRRPLRPPVPPPEARVVRHIAIYGTQRIEPSTVISYITLREGDIYNEQTTDIALKTLYQTGLFADVKIKFDGSTLTINVVENPIINQIDFEGNSKVSQKDLEKEVQLKPRTVFTARRCRPTSSASSSCIGATANSPLPSIRRSFSVRKTAST